MAEGHLQKILDKHVVTSQAYNDERSWSQFTKQKTIQPLKKKVAEGHLQKILGKHLMTSRAYNDERSWSQFTAQKTI